MDNTLDLTISSEILTQLAQQHYYAKDILGTIPGIMHLVNENEQLHSTIIHILNQIDFSKSHSVKWSQLGQNEKNVIDNFFDYLYFTSPQFLKEVS
jgi:hypothetical protein